MLSVSRSWIGVWCVSVLWTAAGLFAAETNGPILALTVEPLRATGIYELMEKAGWTITVPEEHRAAAKITYTLKENGKVVLQSGALDLKSGLATVSTTLKKPATLLLELTVAGEDKPRTAGAAIAPRKLQPAVKRPKDFDAFWAEKLKQLAAIPPEPQVTPGDSGREGAEYATIRLNNINGAHVYGQLAKPQREGKFPAVLIMQWASPPYPLQKNWVTDRAAEGWLALNVEPHDVPSDLPAAYYAALPQMIKDYRTIYDDDRDRNYFLQMYLGDVRALDYLASRADWNGQVLVAMGTSMGGQQSFAVAGLCPQVTHMIVHVPAGADALGSLHGRAPGYPNWNMANPKVVATAPYFDTVNFASRIRATTLVGMGFIDQVCPSVGIWTAFNQIPGRKEIVPLIDAAHNHQATAEQQRAYTERSKAWLAALAKGEAPEVR